MLLHVVWVGKDTCRESCCGLGPKEPALEADMLGDLVEDFLVLVFSE